MRINLSSFATILLLVIFNLSGAQAVVDSIDPVAVGARLEFPDGCRGDQYDTVHTFINEYAPLYGALEVARKARFDKAVLTLYNINEQPVDTLEVSNMYPEEMVEQLGARGIQFWTPKPAYDRRVLPTARCVAWRQLSACDGDATLEPQRDEHCSTILARDRAGYCECANGKRVPLACGRSDFVNCESQCSA